MRLPQFLKFLFLVGCLNLAFGSSYVAQAQTNSKPELLEKNWVLTSFSSDGSSITNLKELTRLSNGNLLVLSVVYYSAYDAENNLRGYYHILRDEVNCTSKSTAPRELQLYSLRGKGVGERFEYDNPLSQSFPETVSRFEIESVCRLAELGPNKDDPTFASIADFIRTNEQMFPPKGPPTSTAVPKRKARPR